MGFGDIKSINDLYNFLLSEIDYGFIDHHNNKLVKKNSPQIYYLDTLFREYYLQSPFDVINNKIGLCYDHVELMRHWLIKHGYDVNTFYSNIYNHSIITFKDNDKYYWMETSLKKYIGIHEYKSINILLNDYINKMMNDTKLDYDLFELYYFNDVKYGCDFYDYVMNIKNKKDNLILSKKRNNS